MKSNPVHDADKESCGIAQRLLTQMRHAVLGTLDPVNGVPMLSQIATQVDEDGCPIALLAGLAAHSRALVQDPRAGLLVTDTSAIKGDVMTHARLSLEVVAIKLGPDEVRRARWLQRDPKARIYIGLPDFSFWRLTPVSGLLNAGFGRAYKLGPEDILIPPTA